MALKTLKHREMIDGFHVVVMDELRDKYPERFNESGAMDYEWFEKEIRPNNFIYVRNDKNSISFTLQNGPVKEAGLNGCQVDTIIETAKIMLEGLNDDYPCLENQWAILYLGSALRFLKLRKMRRERQGTEGTSIEEPYLKDLLFEEILRDRKTT